MRRPTIDLEHNDFRFVLLRYVQLVLLAVTILVFLLVFIDNPAHSSERQFYGYLVGAVLLLLLFAFVLLRRGLFLISAGITVALPLLGSWLSFILDPAVCRGDLFPLLYIALSIMLSSLLLPKLVTIVLAIVQSALLVGIFIWFPALLELNWVSFLFFMVAAFVLSIVTNHLLGERVRTLQTFAITDSLTGLLNRRYFEMAMEHRIHEAKVKELQPNADRFGVILLDIDYFKQFNDTYGHATGDLVLREFSRFLKHMTPVEAILCRFGGDEFAVITNGDSQEDINRLAEHLRRQVKSIVLTFGEKKIGPLSLSLGVAHFPEHGTTTDALFTYADRALFTAKQEGRDRVR